LRGLAVGLIGSKDSSSVIDWERWLKMSGGQWRVEALGILPFDELRVRMDSKDRERPQPSKNTSGVVVNLSE
jgi:hypothetical protein